MRDENQFARDWEAGLPSHEMAWRHGYRDASSVRRKARQMGLPTRPGGSAVLRTPEQEAAFRSDWALGMPARELAALHGFTNVNSVTRAARRLGLPRRTGGRPWKALTGGRWERRGLVQVWVPDEEGAA